MVVLCAYLVVPELRDAIVECSQSRLQQGKLRVETEEEQHEEKEDAPQPGQGQSSQGLGVDDKSQTCQNNLAFASQLSALLPTLS